MPNPLAVFGGSVASSLLGGNQAAKAAKKGAQAQVDAANMANAMEERMYNQSRQDQMPWMEQGKTSLNQLAALMKPGGELSRRFTQQDFETDPGYQFRLEQGNRGLMNALNARGLGGSGAMVKEATRYNQGAAADEYTNAYNRFMQGGDVIYNRLAGLSNTGQTTSQQLSGLGQDYAGQYSSNVGQAANARASQYAGKALALQQGLGSILSAAGTYYGKK
jgi:hypothetical protein